MNRRGFTLVEVIITIAILATLAAIIFPSANYLIGRYQSEQCLKNQEAINSLYPSFLENEGLIDLSESFQDFLSMTKTMACPEHGTYSWSNINGKVSCSIHSDDESYRSYYEKIYKEMKNDFKNMTREEYTYKYDEYRIGGDVLLSYLGKIMGQDGITTWIEASKEVETIVESIKPPINPTDKELRELPLFLKDGIVLYYSAKSSEFNQGQWAGVLVYCPLNDSYYYSEKKTYDNKYTDHKTVLYPGGTNNKTQSDYLAWLESADSGWKKVEK